jgi:hypothetical protein
MYSGPGGGCEPSDPVAPPRCSCMAHGACRPLCSGFCTGRTCKLAAAVAAAAGMAAVLGGPAEPVLTSLKAMTLMLLSMRWLRISRSTFLSICRPQKLSCHAVADRTVYCSTAAALLTLSPRCMNLTATSSLVCLSRINLATPKLPLPMSRICQTGASRQTKLRKHLQDRAGWSSQTQTSP